MQFNAALFILSLTSFVLTSGNDSLAEKRVALVIGNSAYKNAATLPNPTNDAAAVAALFKSAGFDVVDSYQNLGGSEMRRVIRDFTDKVRDTDIAVMFYAGHGMEVDGVNYLIPVDAMMARDADAEDEAVPLDRLTRMLDSAKRLRLVMLDACRDNPFVRTMKRTMGTRAITRGLAKVEPTSSDTLIAFAAKAGSTALDGTGENSPFTTALVKNIAVPGLDLRIAFGRVRDDVLKATGNRQEPFVYGSLGGKLVSLVPPVAPPIAPAASNPDIDIRHDYELVFQVGTKQAWESFLSIHRAGLYADLARQQLAKLEAEDTRKADEARKAEAARKAEEAKRVNSPAATASQPAPAGPKSAEAPKSNNQVVCNSYGCAAVKPGCVVAQRPIGMKSSGAFENYVRCN